MTYSEFKAAVVEEMESRNPEGVEVREVLKNNDRVKDALILKKEKDVNMTPTVYLNDFYGYAAERALDVDEVVDLIEDALEKNTSELSFETQSFTDWERAKQNIVFKLINEERNASLLTDVPSKPVGDTGLVLVFTCLVQANGMDGSILVRNEHLKIWGITTSDLFEAAEQNTKSLLPAEVIPMENLLAGLGFPVSPGSDDAPAGPKMFVVSNNRKVNGAGTILYKGILENVAKENGVNKLFILPSSIHECLVIPDDGALQKDSLSQMVRDVNESQLLPEEILGDQAYTYDLATDKIVA